MGPTDAGSQDGQQDATGTQGPPNPGGDPDAPEPPESPLPTNSTYPVLADWSECDSVGTGFFLPGRPEDFPRPPGWMPPETTPAVRVLLQGFECERLSWGDFERPVRMLLESHNSGQGRPESCGSRSGVTIHNEILASLWVDDAEVAAFLDTTYGMPVHHAPITFETMDLPVGHESTFTWGEGDSESWFSVTDDIGHQGPDRVNFRYYWYNGTVLGAMEFFYFYSSDQTADNPAVGEMQPPMLMSNYSQDYASIGARLPDARVEGHLELYGDLACEEPL